MPRKVAAQRSEPAASKIRKRLRRIWKTPASGGATVLRPGRNLAKISERAPCFENTPSVRRTQESGSMEILQRNWRTLMPLRRPSAYHMESAETAAKIQTERQAK